MSMRSAGSWFAAFFLAGAVFAMPALAQAQTPPAVGSETPLSGGPLGETVGPAEAADFIIRRPSAVHPYYFARVVDVLWARGDRRQAAFWYYLFQSRSRAWAETEPKLNDLRGALNDSMGPAINSWAASDLDAWQEIGARAISYEKKIPLYAGRPEGLSASQWTEAVSEWRKKYQDGFISVFPKTVEERRQYAAKRRQRGLYVGPLLEPGKPLPDDWR
ncbi:hypothetical protein J8I29_10825 [Labrys sp. LIt4]|uniref:hypothetical protein n=1 Tax=Labrys sp. LIt4 TaxID=2821355 RepID=UPI001ADF5354|nr:hypothetical protein [Labrys sp. LIt4]MBP0579802.1 hypothetical protein [Labrys sp. LIt4]